MIVLSVCFFDAVDTEPRTKSYTSHDPVAPFGKDVADGTNPWACAQQGKDSTMTHEDNHVRSDAIINKYNRCAGVCVCLCLCLCAGTPSLSMALLKKEY